MLLRTPIERLKCCYRREHCSGVSGPPALVGRTVLNLTIRGLSYGGVPRRPCIIVLKSVAISSEHQVGDDGLIAHVCPVLITTLPLPVLMAGRSSPWSSPQAIKVCCIQLHVSPASPTKGEDNNGRPPLLLDHCCVDWKWGGGAPHPVCMLLEAHSSKN